MDTYLYRGVNRALDKENGGKLVPKGDRVPFRQWIKWGGDALWGDGCTWGESTANAVVMHQRSSEKNRTSGVSTTPRRQHAERYATHNGKYETGYVYKFDSRLFERHGVSAFVVANYATSPKLPEDQEVILVASDFGPLPSGIIVEKIEINVSHSGG